ncbi:MAG: hypothetical protein V3V25_00315 [Paracoccaceae bacterium]
MDKLVTKSQPLMKFAAAIGMICGVIIIGLGTARYFDLIDMGPDFAKIEPIWMIAGGAALIATFYFKLQTIKKAATLAQDRLDS